MQLLKNSVTLPNQKWLELAFILTIFILITSL